MGDNLKFFGFFVVGGAFFFFFFFFLSLKYLHSSQMEQQFTYGHREVYYNSVDVIWTFSQKVQSPCHRPPLLILPSSPLLS